MAGIMQKSPVAFVGPKVALLPIGLPTVSVPGYTRRFNSRAIGGSPGDVVNSWPDAVGTTTLTTAGASMTGATAPVLVAASGSIPAAVRFTKASSQALGQSLTRVSPHTVVTVGRWWSAPSGLEALTSSGNQAQVNLQGSSGSAFRTFAGSSLDAVVAPGVSYHVFTSVFAGAASIGRIDNTEVTGNPGTALSSALTLGAWGSTYSNVEIVDVFYYPFALDATQRSTLATELKAVYGIS